jgi:hypothetical protein
LAQYWNARMFQPISVMNLGIAGVQRDLAAASSVSLPTVKRLEAKPGIMAVHMPMTVALRKALEAAGIEFTDENGGGPGVRLRKRHQKELGRGEKRRRSPDDLYSIDPYPALRRRRW